MPQVHPGPSGRLLGPRDLLFQQGKDLLIDFRGLKDPLESPQHGWQFVPTLEGNGYLFNRGLPSLQLPCKSLPHRLDPPGHGVNVAAFYTNTTRFAGVFHNSYE